MATRLNLAGFIVRRTTARAVIRFLNLRWEKRKRTIVFFANANFVTRCSHLRQAIAESDDVMVLNDGIALDLAAILRSGTRFPENLVGTDFTPVFLSGLDRGARVFLLGGQPHVVEAAAEKFSRMPKVDIVGSVDGYSMWNDEAALIRQIEGARPDVLLIALGNPLQEQWILDNQDSLPVPLIFAVGALFDFVSGFTPRAPRLMRKLRLEWAYRLMREPRRLVGRYTVGTARFFGMVLFEKT